jgi:hypothetical protein
LVTEKEVYLSIAESNFMQISFPELSPALANKPFLSGLFLRLSLVGPIRTPDGQYVGQACLSADRDSSGRAGKQPIHFC